DVKPLIFPLLRSSPSQITGSQVRIVLGIEEEVFDRKDSVIGVAYINYAREACATSGTTGTSTGAIGCGGLANTIICSAAPGEIVSSSCDVGTSASSCLVGDGTRGCSSASCTVDYIVT